MPTKSLLKNIILPVFALTTFSSVNASHSVCTGFVPENDKKIYVSDVQSLSAGVGERDFHNVLDRIERFYAPVVGKLGKSLSVVRKWEDPTVNAYAEQYGSVYQITMFGGLARYHEMTPDGFMLVACHEMGHHLAGAPRTGSWLSRWASNEGQSDYYATLRCLRSLWTAASNREFVKTTAVDPVLKKTCLATWKQTSSRDLCQRSGMAGLATASLFRWLSQEKAKLAFDTPDRRRVSRTFHDHPPSQCRLDTYFQGALCIHDTSVPLDGRDVRRGTCTQAAGYRTGNRPRCWFEGTTR